MFLRKTGSFTVENHVHVKALKMQGFPKKKCLTKPLFKNSTQTFFQGGTPWVAQILNNVYIYIIVSRVLYCAQQLFGRFFCIWKKTHWQ